MAGMVAAEADRTEGEADSTAAAVEVAFMAETELTGAARFTAGARLVARAADHLVARAVSADRGEVLLAAG